MITWKFDFNWQKNRYKEVKEKLKTGFYQNHKFYVLPFMPEKFRNRVVFLPEVCEPNVIYKKQRIKLQKLEAEWKNRELGFVKNIKNFFPKVKKLDIFVFPSFYGPVGSFEIDKNKIIIKPRYDRSVEAIQKLLVNALTNKYLVTKKTNWRKIQDKVNEIQDKIFPNSKLKQMKRILDSEFAGKLAEENNKYLESLKVNSKFQILKPNNLTKSEKEVFNLLLRNKNKLVTYDQIAETIWGEFQDEKFSEYAITKLVERLKKKLPINIIHSQRGIGYLLFS